MKKKQYPKREKNIKQPLTSFGELLKKAVEKPIEQSSEKIKTDEKNSSEKKQITVSSVKPKSLQAKPNLTYKLTDVAKHTVKENKTLQSAAQNKSDEIGKQNSPPKRQVAPSSTITTEKKQLPIKTNSETVTFPKNETIEPSPKPIIKSDNSQKYVDLMREKFWQNLKGEIGAGHEGRALRINLGIDLGTSFSKVVCRLGGESFPVRFGESKNKIEDYLLPSVIVIGSKGINCRFEFENLDKLKKAAFIPNFKICLTCERGDNDGNCTITKCNLSNLKPTYLPQNIVDEEAMFLNAFYLAKLIGQSKTAVRRQLPERGIPSDITIKWIGNMAVPDKYIDSDVAEGFRKALEIGWLMSEVFPHFPDFTNKSEIADFYLSAKELHKEIKTTLQAQNMDFDCFIYSEIGAAVAAVTLSPTSEEGLYAFVDVGAGTVDTSVFRFRRSDGEPLQETYAANVFKLGAAQIDARANQSFARKSLDWLRLIKENLFQFNTEELFKPVTEDLKIAAEEVTAETRDKLVTVFKEAFSKQNNINAWTSLKLVIGGGGGSIQSYQEAAQYAFSLKGTNNQKVVMTILRVPGDFQMGTLPANQFHRFAVAYGLSRDLVELPELVAPHQVLPMNNLRQRIYIDPTNDG